MIHEYETLKFGEEMNEIDYSKRIGVLPISWDHFHGICKALAQGVAAFQPELILAIGRGGFYPGTLVAHMLRVEIYPLLISRRINDEVVFEQPKWKLGPPSQVKSKRVLIVDEICGQGKTLTMVKEKVDKLGAGEVRSAVLYAHTWGVPVPDYIGLIFDALILNPWDREILVEGEFQFHPEYVRALALQHSMPDATMFIQAPAVTLAKG
jgi:uncharacterized protein